MIKTEICAASEYYIFYSYVRLTKCQIRQEKRAFRNGTHFLFDRHVPPVTRQCMHRMKGAKQAYARRPKSWADLQ